MDMDPFVEEFQIGRTVTLKRTFQQSDFERFAALSGDDNPIHVDPEFSARTRFGKTVAHGMLLYSVIWAALRTHFPDGTQARQQLMFPSPTFAGEEVMVCVQVLEAHPEERWARLETKMTKPSGDVACQGETLVRWNET